MGSFKVSWVAASLVLWTIAVQRCWQADNKHFYSL